MLGAATAIGLFVFTLAVYSAARTFQFISLDDPQYVSANPVVLNGLTQEGFRWALTTSSFYWHPLTWLSHMADVELFGRDAGAHHMMNVVLHAASTSLLFLALKRLTGFAGRSALIAALFAVHPLHVESVAWVAERKDVLSTFFLMAALYAYAGYARMPAWRQMGVVAALFGLGLLAKPMIATFPFVLLVLDYWPLRRLQLDAASRRRGVLKLFTEKAVLFALSATSVAITVLSQRGTSTVVALEALPWSDRIGNAIVSYAVYMRDMFWPARLAVFYPLTKPSLAAMGISLAIVAAITVAAWRLRLRAPWFLIGWLWYLGSLVPVIGLMQAGDQGRADRFTYVPLVGLFIAIVWLLGESLASLSKGRYAFSGLAVTMTLVLSILCRQQLSYWENDLAVWGRAVAVTTGNYRAENHYGIALTDRGHLDEGVRHYEAALRIWPDYAEAHNNLGTARMDQSRFNDAIKEFAAAARVKPNSSSIRYNLAVALDAAGRRAEAIEEVKTGLKTDPAFPDLLRAAAVFGIATTGK